MSKENQVQTTTPSNEKNQVETISLIREMELWNSFYKSVMILEEPKLHATQLVLP